VALNDGSAGQSRRFEVSTPYGKSHVWVTNDHLTVDSVPGDAFPLAHATLGLWALNGAALHLQSGPNHFIIGGRNYRIPSRIQLDVPPVESLYAAMRAKDFHELLTIVAPLRGWDMRPPEPGQPVRCALMPNTSRGWPEGFWPGVDLVRQHRRSKLPPLALAIRHDAVWVLDAYTGAVVASASTGQVTATPTNYILGMTGIIGRVMEFINGGGAAYSPVMVLTMPGLAPLTIGCPIHRLSYKSRFAWRGTVPRGGVPDYVVSGTDWLTLVERFGLSEQSAVGPEYDPTY
jgi:hypothetical protein